MIQFYTITSPNHLRYIEELALEAKDTALTQEVFNFTGSLELRGVGFLAVDNDEYRLLDGEKTLKLANPEEINALVTKIREDFRNLGKSRHYRTFFNRAFFRELDLYHVMAQDFEYASEYLSVLEVINSTGDISYVTDAHTWRFLATIDPLEVFVGDQDSR